MIISASLLVRCNEPPGYCCEVGVAASSAWPVPFPPHPKVSDPPPGPTDSNPDAWPKAEGVTFMEAEEKEHPPVIEGEMSQVAM